MSPRLAGSWVGLAIMILSSFGIGALFQKYIGLNTALGSLGLILRSADPAIDTTTPAIASGLPEELYGRLSLFVLAGQSNMSGRGPLAEPDPPHPRVYTFGNDYRWKLAIEPVDDPAGQVDLVSEDGPRDPARLGPGLSFARFVADRSEIVMGLIPCAKGDTTVAEWQRSMSDSTLYGSCLKRVRAASLAGEVAGILFFQGEADALAPERHPRRVLDAESYGARFSSMVEDLRRDLGDPAANRIPLVFAQIGTQLLPGVFANWDRIREQQRSLTIPCSAMIVTDDLPLQDSVHFTTDAYRTIGERFGAAYLGLVQGGACGVARFDRIPAVSDTH